MRLKLILMRFFQASPNIEILYNFAHQLKAHMSMSRNAVMIKDQHNVPRRNKSYSSFMFRRQGEEFLSRVDSFSGKGDLF